MEDDSTALFVAAMKGNYALVDLLITAGADVTLTDRPCVHTCSLTDSTSSRDPDVVRKRPSHRVAALVIPAWRLCLGWDCLTALARRLFTQLLLTTIGRFAYVVARMVDSGRQYGGCRALSARACRLPQSLSSEGPMSTQVVLSLAADVYLGTVGLMG
jgi:hypothetical protein